MRNRNRTPLKKKSMQLRFESLEDRRLLTVATAVALQVNTTTEDAQLIFTGAQQITSYEIDSASGQLATAKWKSLSSQGNANWTTVADTKNEIAEKISTGNLSNSAVIDLGDLFTASGTQDLTFKWTDQTNTTYTSTVQTLTACQVQQRLRRLGIPPFSKETARTLFTSISRIRARSPAMAT